MGKRRFPTRASGLHDDFHLMFQVVINKRDTLVGSLDPVNRDAAHARLPITGQVTSV